MIFDMIDNAEQQLRDLIVITVMYFDAYLKGRNQNHPNNQTQTINHPIQSSHKYSTYRPPPSQPNFISKPPTFHEVRMDNHKYNSSAHIFLSAAKNNHIPPKISHNYQVRPQTNIANLGGASISRHQLTDDKKYICHSPLKINNRPSEGLVFEEIPQNRYNYRRSESITNLASNQSLQDASIKNNLSTLRTTLQYQPSSDNRAINNSPLQMKYNVPINNPAESKVGKLMRKETGEGWLLTNRQEKGDYTQSNMVLDKSHQNVYQNKSNITNWESKPYQSNYRSSNTQSKFPQICQTPNISTFSNIPNAPLQFVKRQSSQDFLRKFGVSRIPELDKTLDKDIETLKLTHKKSQELMERQMNKNMYLNQLFENKASKGNIDDKKSHIEQRRVSIQDRIFDYQDVLQQKKQLQTKNICLEKEVEDKKKQLFQKNKELSQKSKNIIEKNMQIEAIALELRALQQKNNQLVQNQSSKNEAVLTLQRQIIDKSNKIRILQNFIKQKEQQYHAKISQKCNDIQIIEKQRQQQNNTANQLQKDIFRAKETIQNLGKIMKEKESQYQLSIASLTQQINKVKERFSRQKTSLINTHLSELNILKEKEQNLLASLQRSNNQCKCILQNEISSLKQCNKLLEQELSLLKKEYQQISQFNQIVNDQYAQIGFLLQITPNFSHQRLIARIKQILQLSSKNESMPTKQIQRLQQEHLQRRHVQLNRQLKKVGSRLAGVSIQAQQGGRLLRDANNHIFLMNLVNLNEKYRYLQESQQ